MKVSFHIHSTGSDGKMAPEDVVKEAIRAGITHMCFTDHFRRPKETVHGDYPDTHFYNAVYKKEIEDLKKKYAKEISISFGVELDWIEGYEDWIKKIIKENKFDFILGSIHILKINGKWLSFDSPETWKEATKQMGGVKELLQKYYEQIRLIAKSKLYDCIGHFDYIKILNKNSELFSDKEEGYRKEVLETLDEIKKGGMCLEVNARGWRKAVGEQYPSEWVLVEARKRGIPITIGTDFHGRGDEKIDENLDRAYELARKVGYKSILMFKNRKREEIML